jgi:hypothetical protein
LKTQNKNWDEFSDSDLEMKDNEEKEDVQETSKKITKKAIANEKTFLLTFRYLLEATVHSNSDYQVIFFFF